MNKVNDYMKIKKLSWVKPKQINVNIFCLAVAYGAGKFVAVGYDGYITTSTDGMSWSEPMAVGTHGWNAISYGDGKFVAVRNNGCIVYSKNEELVIRN